MKKIYWQSSAEAEALKKIVRMYAQFLEFKNSGPKQRKIWKKATGPRFFRHEKIKNNRSIRKTKKN